MRRSLPLVLWLALGFSPAGAQETGASGLPEPAPRPTGGEPSPAGRPEKRVDGFRPAPRPTAGAPAAAPDSLTAPDSISTPESLRAAGPFPAPGTPDSLGPAPGARGWDPRWLLAALPSAAADTLLTRARLAVSSGMVLADALERESALGLFRAGGHGAWDQPYRIGPGAERFSLWAGGLPSAGPAIPEANLATMTPLSLDRLVRLAPDPLLDPLACGQDGLLWGEGAPPEQGPAVSAVRLTQGAGGSTTEDFVLSRRSGPWGIAGGFAHSRADGRPFWIVPRYGASRYQNLALALDRAIGGCALRVTGEERAGRAVLAPGRKLVWESRLASAGWQRMGERSTAEALLIRRNDLLRWWGDEGTDRRRTTSTEAHLRGGWRAGSGRLLCAAAAERVALSYAGEGRGARSEEISGAGLAIAGSWPGERRSLYAAVGYSDPWWGDGHARAHLLAARRWGVWKLALEGGRHATAPFTPRLDGDGRALLEQGLLLPGGERVDAGPVREATEAEARLELGRRSHGLRVGWIAREVTGALGVDPLRAADLAPGARDTLGVSSGLVRYQALSFSIGLRLPLGGRLEADGLLVARPGKDALPVLVPRGHGRALFAIGRTFFQGDLQLEGRLVATARDAMATPAGHCAPFTRYDAEIHGRLVGARFFLAVRNLGNRPHDSATYADGAWMPLPYRSTQAGVEWHFRD